MRHSLAVADDLVEIRWSSVDDGDFHIDGPRAALLHRRAAFAPGRWSQLDEVHGTDVVVVDSPGAYDFAVGDAMVTSCRGAVLSVWVGDCAPVVLVADGGAIGAAHAGWRGARDGVLQRAVDALRAEPAGVGDVRAFLGPCIHPCCYEFGGDDLDSLVARFGERIRSRTSWGTGALDMRRLVAAALEEVGVSLTDLSSCTGCDASQWFSHRRGQRQRQVMTVCRRTSR